MIEFSLCSDIASRTALYALAKACNKDEIIAFYVALKEALKEGGYDPDKSDAIVDQFKEAAIILNEEA